MTDLLEPEVDVVFEPDVEWTVDPAHIIFPNVGLGEKALTLCGVKHKVKVPWDDLPSDHPVCRPCAEAAVHMLSEANSVIGQTMLDTLDLMGKVREIADRLSAESMLTEHVEDALAYQDERFEKRIAKAARADEKAEAKALAAKKKSKKGKSKKD